MQRGGKCTPPPNEVLDIVSCFHKVVYHSGFLLEIYMYTMTGHSPYKIRIGQYIFDLEVHTTIEMLSEQPG